MWQPNAHVRRFVALSIALCVVVVVAGQFVTSYAQSASSDVVAQQIRSIRAQGTIHDVIPVIITLQDTAPLDAVYSTASEKTLRIQTVAQQESAFLQRNTQVFRTVKGTTKSIPVVFAQLSRANLDLLLYDKQITSISIDEAVPALLSESTDMIGARSAVLAGYDGTGTSVAILDTGVAKNHVFLSGQVVGEACFSSTVTTGTATSTSLCPGGVSSTTISDSGLPCPSNLVGCNHGTHVAGIIAGKRQTPALLDTWYDSTGISHTSEVHGVAPGTKIIAIKVFSRFPAAYCGGGMDCIMSWTSDQYAALDWVYTNAQTPAWGTLASINMSLGGGVFTSTCDTNTLKRPIDMLRTLGVATIIASGNNSATTGISAPACISSAIAVGASASNKQGYTPDTVASFSNAPSAANNTPNANGDRLLDMMAPGISIYSSYAYPINAFSRISGTSMATPHVAGAWAILKGLYPNATVTDILAWFTASGVAIDANKDTTIDVRVPRVDVNAAVTLALNPNTVATQTMQASGTAAARLTQTTQAGPTQTMRAAMTQTMVSASTATSAARQTATALQQQTQTSIAQPTQTAAAQATQTMAAVRTATVAMLQTSTAMAQQTATAVAQITRTANTALTQTMAVQQTATTESQRTSTAIQRQTDTAVAYITRTAIVALTQTDTAARSATTIAGRTQTAEIVNPTNTAIRAVTQTAASDLTQTAYTIRTATTESQRTSTAIQRQTDTAVAYITRTVIVALTQTDTAARSATTIAGRTQTAEIVNPTNTAIRAVTQTAARDLTQTAYAMRTATTIVQQTATSEARMTNTAVAYLTRTVIIAITQTSAAERTAISAAARTATRSAFNTTATSVIQTAMVVRTQTAIARTAISISNIRFTPTPSARRSFLPNR